MVAFLPLAKDTEKNRLAEDPKVTKKEINK
jgi:hypothetical protein